jgi:glutathione S-transferase
VHPITKQIRDAIANATEGLSETQMRQHPEGKWDTAAILEHLAMAYGSTARLMDKCIGEGRPLATAATFKQRVGRVIVLGFSFIPGGRKAPERVVPTLSVGGKEALQMIFANLEKMDQALARCENRFGSKVDVADHLVLGPIPVDGWRKFHLLHTRHHMKQIDAIRRDFGVAQQNVAAAS